MKSPQSSAQPPAPRSRGEVLLENVGCGLCITFEKPSALRCLDPLQASFLDFDRSDGACRLVTKRKAMVFPAKDSRSKVYCGLGLRPVVLKLLTDRGFVVREIHPPQPLAPPDWAQISGHKPIDRSLLEFIAQKDRGLIRYRAKTVSPAWLIAQIALAYPELTIAVAGTTIRQVQQAAWTLKKSLSDVTLLTHRSPPRQAGRVVVATYSMLGDDAIRLKQRRILIALNAIEAVGLAPLRAIWHAIRARVYGLLGDEVLASPTDADPIRRYIGIDQVWIPQHGHVYRPIEVRFLPIQGGGRLDPGLDPVALRRRGLWQHPVRNRRIARLARWIAANDRQGLEQAYPAVYAALGNPANVRVAILVEALEHGLALARQLPGWPLRSTGDILTTGLAAGDLARIAGVDQTGRPGAGCSILTLDAAAQIGVEDLDVVIDACGGSSRSWLLQDAIAAEPTSRRLLVIDFQDRHHPRLRQESHRRLTAYQERGWAGADYTPVDRFLAELARR